MKEGKYKVIIIVALLFFLIANQQTIDPYQVLGLTQGASRQEVKKAFKELSLQYHPDRSQTPQQAREQYQLIVQAYEIIKQEWLEMSQDPTR